PVLNYGNPIRFDYGAVRRLSDSLDKLGIKRPLVVTDRGLREAGVVDQVLDGMSASADGVAVYDGTPGNPTEDAVGEAMAAYRSEGRDGVVCLGGGSPIDLGKAMPPAVSTR
ncbi:MAG: iron-containing alcohol dehydrogenase, partial [Salinisphaera sp.]|nr:iron-containing alcohol dehydrogenase [Salinisphaera sp.]